MSALSNFPAATHDYQADCEDGRHIAESLIAHIRKARGSPLLGHVARNLGQRSDGVVAGFWARISECIH